MTARQPFCPRSSTLCPALSLPDLFSGASGGTSSSAPPGASSIRALLSAVPKYFSQAVITPDGREATLAFGIRLMPLARQQRVIDYMRTQLRPPPGVTAQLAGVPVLAAEANASDRLRVLASIYHAYQQRLQQAGLSDFRDLISGAIELLQSNSLVRERLRARLTAPRGRGPSSARG